MDLRQWLEALRRNVWFIIVATVIGGCLGGVAYVLTPPSYSSTVTFYVGTPSSDDANALWSGEFAQSRVNSYLQLMTSGRLTRQVVADTHVDLTPRAVAQRITTSSQAGTVLVTATVEDSSQARAQQIAQGIADVFGPMVDQLDNAGRKTKIVVISTVSGPTELGQVAPSLKKRLGPGIAAGLAAGILIGLLRELLDITVRTAEVAQELAGAPAIGSIYADSAARRSPLIVGDQANSRRAESYRQMRTNLQFIEAAKRADVLLVTSSVSGEGKSTTVVNLALSFVEFGARVLVIDADLRRPKLAEYLSLEGSLGLTDVLVGEVSVHEVLQQRGSDELYLLSSGSVPPNPSELLGSDQMANLVKELAGDFDKIIIDSPPVLPVTDASVVSALVDGVIVVARYRRTPRAMLSRTAQALARVNARLLGVVLTMRKTTRAERRHYGPDDYYAAGTVGDSHDKHKGNQRASQVLNLASVESESGPMARGEGAEESVGRVSRPELVESPSSPAARRSS